MAEEFSLYCCFQTRPYPFFLDQQNMFMLPMEIFDMHSVIQCIGHVLCFTAILYIRMSLTHQISSLAIGCNRL